MSAHTAAPKSARSKRQGWDLPEPLYERLPPGPCNDPEHVAASQFERLCGAMAHGVALHSYERLSVRELCALAAVAPKALYRHFPGGMHECFLGAQEQAVLRAGRRIAAAQAHEHDRRSRLRLALGAFARLLAEEPRAAHLVLLEAQCVSPQTREHAQHTATLCALALAELLGCPCGSAPPLAVGIVAGVAHVARELLLEDRAEELPALAEELAGWALRCCDEAARTPQPADRPPPPCANAAVKPACAEPAWADDERSRLMRAAIELLAKGEELRLNGEMLAARAGVPKRRVEILFGGARPCMLAAIDRGFARLLGEAAGRVGSGDEGPARAQRMLGALLAHLAQDPALARAAFAGLPSLGREGVRLRESLIGSLAVALSTTPPDSRALARLAPRASAGAVWGAIEHRLAAGRAAQPPASAELACLLVQAPVPGTRRRGRTTRLGAAVPAPLPVPSVPL